MADGTSVYSPHPNSNTTDPGAGNERDSDYSCGLQGRPGQCYDLTATHAVASERLRAS